MNERIKPGFPPEPPRTSHGGPMNHAAGTGYRPNDEHIAGVLEPEPPKPETCPHLHQNRAYGKSIGGGPLEDIGFNCLDCHRFVAEPHKADTGTLEAAVEARIEQAAADAELYGHLYARDALRDALTAESVRGDEGAMRSRLYRLLMRLAHRHNWHYAPPIYPEGDMQLWCKWCGFRQTVKGRRRK